MIRRGYTGLMVVPRGFSLTHSSLSEERQALFTYSFSFTFENGLLPSS